MYNGGESEDRMDWNKIEEILSEMHCRACDDYGCNHKELVVKALLELKELFGEQSPDEEDE